jgi:hypothetical protein
LCSGRWRWCWWTTSCWLLLSLSRLLLHILLSCILLTLELLLQAHGHSLLDLVHHLLLVEDLEWKISSNFFVIVVLLSLNVFLSDSLSFFLLSLELFLLLSDTSSRSNRIINIRLSLGKFVIIVIKILLILSGVLDSSKAHL